MRFLTDALYAALQYHGRILPDGQRTLIRLLSGTDQQQRAETEERLDEELIPCPPDDDNFETRLKAVLRRHIVERCIYAVDLDPLAVELCRLALWIETMDRTLPFGFIDHKIKCGNALIGAWFDQFPHYPVMAWKNREGGDKTHTNGVHFRKNARTEAIKTFLRDRLTPDLRLFLRGKDLFQEDLLKQATTTYQQALETLQRMHEMPVHESILRSDVYRQDFLGSETWCSLKAAMDLWCACWFWPVDQIEHAPLPTSFANPSVETRTIAEQVATQERFFHWELEFPDVFQELSSKREGMAGFDAVLGNPPWDTLEPNSKEYFSNIDPLYRSYNKQLALEKQSDFFKGIEIESDWLDYNAHFTNNSNWMKHAGSPFGDPHQNRKSQERFSITRGRESSSLHEKWRNIRGQFRSYSDSHHPFRYRGEGKAYTYKLFLEQAYALLHYSGRLGFIIPSGIYSDDGSSALRKLLLNQCKWEWLFGIENRTGIFPIHRSYKFNLVIAEKGGTTEAVQTAFMRRNLEDWERAEEISIPYSLTQVDQFSPRSRAFLEIQDKRDLEILEKIYTNSVLLGDDGPESWGIRYAQGDFNMTNDSHLFPPRLKWETKGYQPDEYSRWLKGNWRPIGELWAEMQINPNKPEPPEIELDEWLFDTTANPQRRKEEAQYIHGHLLKPGDIEHTKWQLRCAQPPYDRLPIPRADIPERVILSREGDAWIREEKVEGAALPLYEGKMIYINNWAAKTDSHNAQRLDLSPMLLLPNEELRHNSLDGARISFRDITNSTNERTMIPALIPSLFPCGHLLPLLESKISTQEKLEAIAYLSSFVFDWSSRLRTSGTHLTWHITKSLPLPNPSSVPPSLSSTASKLAFTGSQFAADRIISSEASTLTETARSYSEQLRLRVICDAIAASIFRITISDFGYILSDCDHPLRNSTGLPPTGFWRVDKNKEPELRHTILALVSFYDLQTRIDAADGNRNAGIETFLNQNNGEGWLLPETLCLADYGLGHDDRAKQPQPVASRLGPRFYDWQLVQNADESWRECHLHARNLLGESGYRQLLENINNPHQRDQKNVPLAKVAEEPAIYTSETPDRRQDKESGQSDMFE